VTVTDNNGCIITATVTITQPTALTANITASTNVLCNGGNNGSATIAAGGGTPNYTYVWTPAGGTNAAGTGLTAGNYTVTVTDANGCTQTAGVTITQPPLLTATISASTNILCNGGNNGNATVIAGGGTPNYTYAWTSAGGTNTNATGLTAGTYTITVTDANGCNATNTITITEPPALTATTSFTQASCNLSNGSATVTVGGGTPNYTYLWTPSGNTNSTATGLSANSYTVVVTDANGCTETATIAVTQPSAVTANITGSTGVSCNGAADGTATVTATGGTGPYTYIWAPSGGTNVTGTGMSAGLYTVTVTDNNGCIITDTITITQPTALTANIAASTNVLCNGGNNGSATVTVGGGTPNYTYVWTPAGGTNATGTGLTAGNYTVTITDANGCTQTAGIAITEPPALTANITASANILCNGGSNGSATVTAGGGTPNYTYLWTPVGGTNTIASGLTAGTYTATVTDANSCSATASVTITEPPALTANIMASIDVSCFGGTNGTATVTAGGGTIPYTYLWSPSSGTNATGTGMAAGNYTVTVTDNNGCTATASIGITQPTVLAVSITGQTGVNCFGGNNGTATSLASGGTVAYAYVWTPIGGTNAMGTGLSAGNYTITVTDANGCTATNSVIIIQPNALTITTAVVTNVNCNGGNNGSASSTVTGGISPYLYTWTPSGGTNATGTGMGAGIYTVTVTDANGCSATATATITQPTALTASIGAINNVKCNGGSNGNATATGAGGTLPYQYLWAPGGGTNALITGLTAGSYSVTVTDANGCSASASVTITQPILLTTSLTSTNVSCFGGNNGSATSTNTGGTTPYAYRWSNAQLTANASNLSAGSYTLTVTDANGCTASAAATITEPTKLTVNASGPQSVCSGAPATLISSATGGTTPYTYSWSPAGGTSATTTTNPVSTTTYSITITDANGCTAITTVFVSVDAPLTLSVTGKNSVCPGGTISLTAAGAGGDGIYSYVWLPSNSTTQTVSFSPTKDTTVTVKLTDGCGSSMVSVTIPIIVDPLPKISLSSDIYTGCIPLCIQFRNMTTISSGRVFEWGWSFGNGDSSNAPYPLYCYKDTGVHSVSLTATSDSGCSSTLNVLNLITVYPPPSASFVYSPNPVNIFNPQVQFTDQSTGKYPISEWYWTFGQGDSTSFQQNPEHTYTDTGTFCAHLMVIDIHGCIDSITNCLVVDPLFTFYIPDAFSPNGDGLNDVFMPKASYVKAYEMYIYDRWGMQLFHSSDINNGWDGTVRGGNTISQEDTYVYLINVTDSQGTQHSYTSKLNLVK
ncbi:MAG TPA: PKD domain-containing protein, partial [Bacteroidia bacterium]|nr:PKD domain-containing protein [Bacteroidia bacterium]